MKILIDTEAMAMNPREITDTTYSDYGGTYRTDTTHRRAAVDEIVNEYDFPKIAPAIVGILAAVALCLLVLPHMGSFVSGFGKVAENALYALGIGIASMLICLSVWAVYKLAVGEYWANKERGAIFTVEKERAICAARANPTAEIPGGFVRKKTRNRVMNTGADHGDAGRVGHRQTLKLQ